MVYEPVELAQDFRTFDFESPWEGSNYVLPGDEKAAIVPDGPPQIDKPKVTQSPRETGAGKKANDEAAKNTPANPPAMDEKGKKA